MRSPFQGWAAAPVSNPSARPSWPQRLRAWAQRLRREGWTLWFAMRHPGTPWLVRLLGAFVVAYAFSPIDLIPDIIPVLGTIDELILLPALIGLALRLLPPPVRDECRRQADEAIASRAARPRSWVGAVGIAAIWLLVVTLLVLAVTQLPR